MVKWQTNMSNLWMHKLSVTNVKLTEILKENNWKSPTSECTNDQWQIFKCQKWQSHKKRQISVSDKLFEWQSDRRQSDRNAKWSSVNAS